MSAGLGHYLANANVPLHTSINHDGQLTNQQGSYGFWESQLPEDFGDRYKFNVPPAIYIDKITSATWQIIKHSHSLADSLLTIERNLKDGFPKNKIFTTDSSGQILTNRFKQPVHSPEYAAAFHDALNGMVQHQMRHAISDIANFWYTAWVNAVKPDLNSLDDPSLTKSNRKNTNVN